MGSEPGSSFTLSYARPGQKKPEPGQRSGSALPIGAQKEASTCGERGVSVRTISHKQATEGTGFRALPRRRTSGAFQMSPVHEANHARRV